ncbi:MAG TPA: hypothetical protein DDW52_27905 [Planctomycetaceae bacterium]|nr:hypothetical protein [Planctomycetaceae bacterium]
MQNFFLPMTAFGRSAQIPVRVALFVVSLVGCAALLTGCAGEQAKQARHYDDDFASSDDVSEDLDQGFAGDLAGEFASELAQEPLEASADSPSSSVPLDEAGSESKSFGDRPRGDEVYTADLERGRNAEPKFSAPAMVAGESTISPGYSLPSVAPTSPPPGFAEGTAAVEPSVLSPGYENPLRASASPSGTGNLRSDASNAASSKDAARNRSEVALESTGTPQRFKTTSSLPTLRADETAVRSAEIKEEIAALRESAPVQLASASERKEPRPDVVTVFFATDREATADLLPGPLRLFGPAAVACIVFCILAIATLLVRRLKFLWGLGAFCAAGMGILVCHTTWVRWQQLDRLATNTSLAFATSRFEADVGRYPLHLGRASLSIPPNHQKGKIESVSILRGELAESPDRHIVLQNVRIEEDDTWFSEIADLTSVSAGSRPLTDGNGVFVFIHGYNVRFDDALKRTAQLSKDLGVKGPAICYSWPSLGQLAGYTADESTVAWSAPHLEQLVMDLRERSGVKSINIVAHSMGNRALLQAVERIGIRMEGVARAAQQLELSNEFTPPKAIDHLVMAAPDVDFETFTSRYVDHLNRVARRRTLYFSGGDRALWVSQFLHGGQRVGLKGAYASLRGIEAIDIGEQSFFSLGHSYYGSEPAVIDDLAAVLLEDKRPSDRRWLQHETAESSEYWKLDRVRHAKLTSVGSIQR